MSEPKDPSNPKKLPSIFDDPPAGMDIPPDLAAKRGISSQRNSPIDYRARQDDRQVATESPGCLKILIIILVIFGLLAVLVVSLCSVRMHP